MENVPTQPVLRPEVLPPRHEIERLSARLAAGSDEDVTDAEIAEVLGEACVPAFRYGQRQLAGKVRRTTREPAFCHSADLALRAADLGYDSHVRIVGLLHDAVEDSCRTLAGVQVMLTEVAELFGPRVARDARLLTNRYAVLLDEAAQRLPRRLTPQPENMALVDAAVRELRGELEPEVAKAFDREFYQVLGYFLPVADVGRGARKARLDQSHTIIRDLRLQSYRLFMWELADDARDREAGVYEAALVVKGLDLVDNLRTTEVIDWQSLERILVKAEVYLDATFFLHDQIRNRGPGGATFISLYDYVKHHLVEQLAERRRALGFLSDSRFAYLAAFVVEHINRVQAKYQVKEDPHEVLGRLREALRAMNGVR